MTRLNRAFDRTGFQHLLSPLAGKAHESGPDAGAAIARNTGSPSVSSLSYMLDTNILVYVFNARPQHEAVLDRFNAHDARELCL